MSKLDDLKIDAPVPKPRRSKKIPWLPFVVLMFIIGLVVYFQSGKLVEMSIAPISTSDANQAVETMTAQLSQGSSDGSISAAGYLEAIPPGSTVVSSLISGMVLEIFATPGQLVEEGELLATLDTALLDQQVKLVASQVQLSSRKLDLLKAGFRSEEIKQAQTVVRSAEAKLELAEKNYESSLTLLTKGVISQLELDSVQSTWKQAIAQLEASQAHLAMLQAGTRTEEVQIAEASLNADYSQLSQLRWKIEQCNIVAPMSGVVVDLFAHKGAWVAVGKDDPFSAAVLSILDPTQVQAWVDVNQRDSASLFVGQRAELTTDAEPLRVVTGTVSRIMPQANLQKNTVQTKICIDDVPADFRPELSVKVVFLPPESEGDNSADTTQSILIPKSAVVKRDDGDTYFNQNTPPPNESDKGGE